MMARPKGKPRPMKDLKQAVEMYIAGIKMTEIAAKFGVTQPTVSYWVKRHGNTLGKDRYWKAVRKQGRRQDKVPSDRDRDIVMKALMGMPVSHIGVAMGMTRQRSSYIVKTWLERGYQPPLPFKNGQAIKIGEDRYTVKKIIGHSGGTVIDANGEELDAFLWYQNGKLCEAADEAPVI